jgi:hypothetical protein
MGQYAERFFYQVGTCALNLIRCPAVKGKVPAVQSLIAQLPFNLWMPPQIMRVQMDYYESASTSQVPRNENDLSASFDFAAIDP